MARLRTKRRNQKFFIKSPSGRLLTVSADGFYHALNVAVGEEAYRFSVKDYLELNSEKNSKAGRKNG
jgi:hypothetical protein